LFSGALALTGLVIVSRGSIALDININDSLVTCAQGTLRYPSSPPITHVMKAITALGGKPFLMVATLAVVGSFILRKTYHLAVFFAFTMMGGTILNHILKSVLARPRPNEICLEGHLTGSFPSGHTMVSTIFFATLAFLLLRRIQSSTSRIFIAVGTALILVFIGFSRLYLGYHWFLDVIGGWLLGFLWTIIGLNLLTYWERRFYAQRP
jgi:undecaprenyl-diphosphatase